MSLGNYRHRSLLSESFHRPLVIGAFVGVVAFIVTIVRQQEQEHQRQKAQPTRSVGVDVTHELQNGDQQQLSELCNFGMSSNRFSVLRLSLKLVDNQNENNAPYTTDDLASILSIVVRLPNLEEFSLVNSTGRCVCFPLQSIAEFIYATRFRPVSLHLQRITARCDFLEPLVSVYNHYTKSSTSHLREFIVLEDCRLESEWELVGSDHRFRDGWIQALACMVQHHTSLRHLYDVVPPKYYRHDEARGAIDFFLRAKSSDHNGCLEHAVSRSEWVDVLSRHASSSAKNDRPEERLSSVYYTLRQGVLLFS